MEVGGVKNTKEIETGGEKKIIFAGGDGCQSFSEGVLPLLLLCLNSCFCPDVSIDKAVTSRTPAAPSTGAALVGVLRLLLLFLVKTFKE